MEERLVIGDWVTVVSKAALRESSNADVGGTFQIVDIIASETNPYQLGGTQGCPYFQRRHLEKAYGTKEKKNRKQERSRRNVHDANAEHDFADNVGYVARDQLMMRPCQVNPQQKPSLLDERVKGAEQKKSHQSLEEHVHDLEMQVADHNFAKERFESQLRMELERQRWPFEMKVQELEAEESQLQAQLQIAQRLSDPIASLREQLWQSQEKIAQEEVRHKSSLLEQTMQKGAQERMESQMSSLHHQLSAERDSVSNLRSELKEIDDLQQKLKKNDALHEADLQEQKMQLESQFENDKKDSRRVVFDLRCKLEQEEALHKVALQEREVHCTAQEHMASNFLLLREHLMASEAMLRATEQDAANARNEVNDLQQQLKQQQIQHERNFHGFSSQLQQQQKTFEAQEVISNLQFQEKIQQESLEAYKSVPHLRLELSEEKTARYELEERLKGTSLVTAHLRDEYHMELRSQQWQMQGTEAELRLEVRKLSHELHQGDAMNAMETRLAESLMQESHVSSKLKFLETDMQSLNILENRPSLREREHVKHAKFEAAMNEIRCLRQELDDRALLNIISQQESPKCESSMALTVRTPSPSSSHIASKPCRVPSRPRSARPKQRVARGPLQQTESLKLVGEATTSLGTNVAKPDADTDELKHKTSEKEPRSNARTVSGKGIVAVRGCREYRKASPGLDDQDPYEVALRNLTVGKVSSVRREEH